ncbi:Integrin beta-PS [Aphelenchoides fujianensis]|nr:Integrin beta-PS [Aphelenchoides fujianensis]
MGRLERGLLLRAGVCAALLLVAASQQWGQDSVSEGEIIPAQAGFPCHSLSHDNYNLRRVHPTARLVRLVLGLRTASTTSPRFSRCDTSQNLLEHGCATNQVVNPQSTLRTILQEPFVEATDEETENIQLRPQEVEIRIRPKSMARFDVTFRQAVDYPVDLYYLMDLSYSMKDDKEKLSQLGDLLAARMRQITKNFRLGFGSFVDKKVMPFVDPRKDKIQSPCPEGCAPTYGFRHQMSLTTNTNKFAKEVDKAEISGNLDAPEGGFDAIIQAIMCNLGGIVTPNDGQCHLDENGYYTKSTEQDYPSIAQIHKTIKDHKVNMIFAVTKSNKHLYDQLSAALPDVSSTGKIAEKIIMVDNANSSMGLKLSYRSKCLDGRTLQDTNVCEGIKVGDEVTFEVTLEATHCVDRRDFELHIGPSGLDETLLLNVHVLCDCDCEEEIIINAPECSGHGNLVCGQCQCMEGYVGDHCECLSGGESAVALEAKCRKDNNSLICSGRGVCKCGVCHCFPRANSEEIVSGQFCECDNFNCPRHDRKLCGGHGECVCGECQCAPGYTGAACECPISKETCYSKNGKECNGHGQCVCGKCLCDPDYSGPFCDICPTCPTKCVEYKPCVMCQQWQTGPYNESKCAECPFTVIPVKELPVLNVSDSETWNECQFVDPADDCTFYFLYYYDGLNNLTVWVKEEKDCPAPLPVLVVVLIVIAGIVLLGLLLLCLWKLLTVIYDRREYVRFEKDRLNARWDANENPIYKQATTTFRNPVYSGETRQR